MWKDVQASRQLSIFTDTHIRGHDRVAVYTTNSSDGILVDEIQQFQDARWVSTQKLIQRIFEFDLNEIYIYIYIYMTIINLQLLFQNKQLVNTCSYIKNSQSIMIGTRSVSVGIK